MVKNIVFVTPYFAPAWSYGGPPRVFYSLARELVRKGKKVKVITCDTLDQRRNPNLKEVLDGVEIFRFRTISNTLSYKLKLFMVPCLLSKTKERLNWADLVLFSDIRTIINWQIYPYLFKNNIPYGIFAFGEIPRGEGLKAVVKKIFDKIWVSDFVEKAAFRFAQTPHEQEMFHRFYKIPKAMTQLLPLPVGMEKVVINKRLQEEFKKKWKINYGDKIILYVGRLHFLKGVDILINALTPFLINDQRLKLMIVGRDDGQERYLKNLVLSKLHDQIIFTGPLYENEVANAYLSSKCFVFTPRFYEETSLAALEALKYGIPVITTQESDIPSLEEYRAGLIVKNDISIIQKAIMKILNKRRTEIDDIKRNAKELISDHFTSDKIILKLLSYFETIK